MLSGVIDTNVPAEVSYTCCVSSRSSPNDLWCKVRTETDVATSSLAVSVDGVFNCLVSFITTKWIIFANLNRELTTFKGTIHYRHCDWQSAHAIKEWEEVASVVLAIISKSPWYIFFHARNVQLPAACWRRVNKTSSMYALNWPSHLRNSLLCSILSNSSGPRSNFSYSISCFLSLSIRAFDSPVRDDSNTCIGSTLNYIICKYQFLISFPSF